MEVGTISEMLDDFKSGVYDFTKDGKCIQCGACCSRYLPLSQKEIKQLKTYIEKHNIKRQNHGVNVLAAPTLDLVCPFLDDTKPDHKCTIYEVRPLVCKTFICNGWDKHRPKLGGDNYIPVDVTETFFPGEVKNWLNDELATLLTAK